MWDGTGHALDRRGAFIRSPAHWRRHYLDKIYQCAADEAHKVGVFGHGFTYSGHPVIAAVAAEAIRIYSEIDFVTQARRLGDHLHGALADALGDHPLVG
ncbi:MAG: aminotransferase class III-fold pyridoxal phosphate-dependent enzyme, partial [Mesorhizobium sp.]